MSTATHAAALTASELSLARGTRQLFADLSFSLEAGSALLLRGANGSGKTSLLRVLAGLTAADRGEVICGETRLRPFASDWRTRLVYAGHADAIKADLSVAENLADLLAFDNVKADAAGIETALAQVQLADRRDLAARRLSQGQKRRISLARLMLSAKPLWLLDEPTNALDRQGVTLFNGIVKAHLAAGGMACIATHLTLEIDAPVRELRLGGEA